MESPPLLFELKKNFTIKSDKNKEYMFSLKLETLIEINIESINEIPNFRYKINYSLEELNHINKYFKLCENITEAYKVIKDNIDSNELELKELDKSLSFRIKTNDKLCGDILFTIPLITKSEKENIYEIYNLIKELKTENVKLSEEKKEMENNLRKELEEIKKENALIKMIIMI